MTNVHSADLPAFARAGVNLASAGLGARAVAASDEFFAPLARMLDDAAAVFYPDRYDDHGKWMDGWETRRRRNGGNDWAVIALAVRGRILGFDIDTHHFTGNFAPAARIEAAELPAGRDPDADTTWTTILEPVALGASAHHYLPCASEGLWTHLRLSIYPDGGVARLRVYGQPRIEAPKGTEIDLVSALNGGRVLALSNAHYGDYNRMLAPGRGLNMGDGWETRRLREPGHDWAVIALGARGRISRVVVDTCHYKGNFPDRCSIQAADLGDFAGDLTGPIVTQAMFWKTLLPEQKLSADNIHEYLAEVAADFGPVTHVRLNSIPDGGISRLRLFGTAE